MRPGKSSSSMIKTERAILLCYGSLKISPLYYDDLILLRSGVINQESYIALLKAQIKDRYLQNPGRAIQSVSESSFDAWVKFLSSG